MSVKRIESEKERKSYCPTLKFSHSGYFLVITALERINSRSWRKRYFDLDRESAGIHVDALGHTPTPLSLSLSLSLSVDQPD